MFDDWYVIYTVETGEAYSIGQVNPSVYPSQYAAALISAEEAASILGGRAAWSPEALGVVPVTPPVPSSVTRWQARRWLVDHGYDLNAIESQFAAIADPLTRARALVDWRDAPVYERTHPLIALVGAAHGFDEAGLDQAFREMAEIT